MDLRMGLYAVIVFLVSALVGLDAATCRAKALPEGFYVDQGQVVEINPDERYVRIGDIQDPDGRGASMLTLMKRARLTAVDPQDPLYYFKDEPSMRRMLDRFGIQPLQRVKLVYQVIGDQKVLVSIKPLAAVRKARPEAR